MPILWYVYTLIATLEEMGALQDRLDSEKEKSLALESELESKDTALREALQSKEALQAEKVGTKSSAPQSQLYVKGKFFVA